MQVVASPKYLYSSNKNPKTPPTKPLQYDPPIQTRQRLPDSMTTPKGNTSQNLGERTNVSVSTIYKKLDKLEKNQEIIVKNQKIIMRDILLFRKEMRLKKANNHDYKIKEITFPIKSFDDFEKLNNTLKTNLEARNTMVNFYYLLT